MSDKLHNTRGIVLRTVKYGETSLIITIFTELFGAQAYLVNGARTSSKKSAGKAIMYQPTAILDLVVYHNEFRQLHRIKEARWGFIYQHVLTDVRKNAVASFMIELLGKCLKQPEPNPELFYFAEDAFKHLDASTDTVMANFPLFFALHLPVFFGFRFSDNYSGRNSYLDLQEGSFTDETPSHRHYLEDKLSFVTSQLLKVQQPEELDDIKLNKDIRRQLLQFLELYYALHVQDFGTMRTLPVVKEILG